MAIATFEKPVIAEEGEQASLTTTASYLLFKPNFDAVTLYSASAWRLAFSPALLNCLYYDASAGTYTNYKTEATDRVSTTHVQLDAMPTTDYLYLGFSEPALGIYIKVDDTNKNTNTATLDVEYCSTAVAPGATIAFTDVAGDSDGTSASATLTQNGVYTWTLPTAWVRSSLGTAGVPLYGVCYWLRFCPSATLSATVDLVDIIPVYKNDNYAYKEASVTYVYSIAPSENSGFVLKGTTTQTLNVDWLKH